MIVIGAAAWAVGEYVDVPSGMLVILLVLVVVLLMLINTPISIALGLACIVYIVARGNIPLSIVPICVIGGMDSFVLLAVPLFIMVGELMNTDRHSGLTLAPRRSASAEKSSAFEAKFE